MWLGHYLGLFLNYIRIYNNWSGSMKWIFSFKFAKFVCLWLLCYRGHLVHFKFQIHRSAYFKPHQPPCVYVLWVFSARQFTVIEPFSIQEYIKSGGWRFVKKHWGASNLIYCNLTSLAITLSKQVIYRKGSVLPDLRKF